MAVGKPSAGYGFNSFYEIKSHSSILFNERMAILFYQLDLKGIEVNTQPTTDDILRFKGILTQIYSNMRMLISCNPVLRVVMNLDTVHEGIYTTDVGFGIIDKMIESCESEAYTPKRLYIIKQELVNLERVLKNILQYYHYFIRPDFKQKPDIDTATIKYKEIADERSIMELKELIGKKHMIDFDSLGTQKIDQPQIDYEDEMDEEEDINDGSNAESDGNYDSQEY